MAIAPNRKDLFEDKVNEGYTKQQAEQLSWIDWWEWERPNYSWNRSFEISCKSCNVNNRFGAADTCRLFLMDHKGPSHKTWFFTYK